VDDILRTLAAVFWRQGGAAPVTGAGGGDPAKRFRPLVRRLNAAGEYMAARDALKPPLLRVAKERCG
jgi:hypothetical protein